MREDFLCRSMTVIVDVGVKVEAGDCETAALASFDPPHMDCFCDFDFLLFFYLFYPRLPISCLFISHHDRGGWRFK